MHGLSVVKQIEDLGTPNAKAVSFVKYISIVDSFQVACPVALRRHMQE